MSEAESPLLARNFPVFNERDEQKRLEMMKAMYHEDAIFYESDQVSVQGLESINAHISEVLKTIEAGQLFRPEGSQEQNHGLARHAWVLSSNGGPVLLSGMDIGMIQDGRIASLYMFINAPAQNEK